MDAGLKPRETICLKCPFANECGYLRQEREIEAMGNRGVFFMANNYLWLPCPAPDADIIIVDECVTIAAISKSVVPLDTFTAERLLRIAGGAHIGSGGNLSKALETETQTLNTIRDVLQPPHHPDPLDAPDLPNQMYTLRARGVNYDNLSRLIDVIDIEPSAHIDGSMSDDDISAAAEAATDRERQNVLRLLRCIRREIDIPRKSLTGAFYGRVKVSRVMDDGKTMDEVEVPCMRVASLQRPRGTSEATLLLLDGTGDIELNRKLFGAELRHEEVRIERTARVTGTCNKRYSRQSITGCDRRGKPIENKTADAKRLRDDVGTLMAQRPGFFLATYLAAEEALENGRHLPPNCKTGHFGNLRGKNAYKECPGSVVIGAQSVSIRDLEWMARAYMADDPAPFFSMDKPELPDDWPCKEWPYRSTRMRRMRDGSLQPVEVDVHPHPVCQAVLEQIREAECVQSGDRCRPIFNERLIVFANNLVLDVTYDEVLTHRELVQGGGRIERILAQTGVVPESRDELVRVFPDIFKATTTAQRDVQAWLEKRDHFPNKIPIWKMVPFSYRRPGQRGRPCRVWISSKHQDPRAAAEAVLGPLASFEPVAEASPVPDVPDVAVPMPDAVPDAAPDIPESAPEPEPEPVAMPVSPPPPILATLRITQADSIILPSPPPVVATARLLQQEQRMIPPIAPPPATEPLPPLPEPDFGSLEFWDEHEFFRGII